MSSSQIEAASSNATYQKPKTRQRIHKPAPALAVPNINDDSAERKRVLNVLAQRRYRERKRQARGSKSSTTGTKRIQGDNTQETESSQQGIASPTEGETIAPQIVDPGFSTCDVSFGGNENLGLDLSGWAHSSNTLDPAAPDMIGEPNSELLQPPLDFPYDDPLILPRTPSSTIFGPAPTTTTTTTTTSSSSLFDAGPYRADPVVWMTNNAFLSPKGTSASTNTTTTSNDNNDGNNDDDSNSFSFAFPDSYLLPMTELALLRAFARIAKRLGCDHAAVWELQTCSPFAGGGGGGALPAAVAAARHANLPGPWRPTAAQRTVPHHPILDFLPWPCVRDRLITVLSLPRSLRPPVAAGGPTDAGAGRTSGGGDGGAEENTNTDNTDNTDTGTAMALVQFAYDLEHTAEGIRIWGGDIYDPGAWEVGQVLFERWWFVFDRQVVEQSNAWRRLRGAAELRIKG